MVTDFYKAYPAYFKYANIHKDEPTALADLEAQSFEIKNPIREALDLPDDGRAKIPLNGTPLAFCATTRKALARICREEGSEELALAFEDDTMMLENKAPSGARLTRAFLKLVSKKDKKYLLNGFSYSAARLERKLQEIYTKIKAENKQFFISTNFVDMLNCSAGSFTSCFRPGGAYSAAAMSMALSERVAMLYTTTTDSTHIVSRAWIVFAEDFSGFFILRAYGDWADSAADAASNWVKTTISAKFGWTSDWKSREDSGVFLGKELQFLDGLTSAGSMYTDPTATAFWYNPDGDTTEFGFLPTYATPKCTICGQEHKDSSLECKDCRRNSRICIECGRKVYSGSPLCPGCEAVPEVTKGVTTQWCAICGKPFEGTTAQKHCPSCVKSFEQTNCACCGKLTTRLYPHESEWKCAACINKAQVSGEGGPSAAEIILNYVTLSAECTTGMKDCPPTLKNILEKAGCVLPTEEEKKKKTTKARNLIGDILNRPPLRYVAVAA